MILYVTSLIFSLSCVWGVRKLSLDVKTNDFIVFISTLFLLMISAYHSNSLTNGIVHQLFLLNLILIAYVDLYTKTIADITLWSLFAISASALFFLEGNVIANVLSGIWGLVFYGFIYFAAKLWYKKEAFGTGDVWLMGGVGLFVSWRQGIMISFFSFYIALLIILILRLMGRKKKLMEEIPFGPYIVLSYLVVYYWGDKIWSFFLYQ